MQKLHQLHLKIFRTCCNQYCNITMKSVPVAPRLEFPHKDGSKYLLISTSFNRLLLEICLTAPLEY